LIQIRFKEMFFHLLTCCYRSWPSTGALAWCASAWESPLLHRTVTVHHVFCCKHILNGLSLPVFSFYISSTIQYRESHCDQYNNIKKVVKDIGCTLKSSDSRSNVNMAMNLHLP
jgi:hypothetical protein